MLRSTADATDDMEKGPEIGASAHFHLTLLSYSLREDIIDQLHVLLFTYVIFSQQPAEPFKYVGKEASITRYGSRRQS